jgi:LmbE family N-acetylglucosaminyl deacetylase
MAPSLDGAGTDERTWRAWLRNRRCPLILPHRVLRDARRLVVVAPHPDDEILGTGGLLAWSHQERCATLIVSVTQGEASHPASRRYTPAELATTRRHERREALVALGAPTCRIVDLALPDGRVADHEARLVDELVAAFHKGDVAVAPLPSDGHPDHDACGRAAAAAAAAKGIALWHVPIWMWHWALPGDPRVPWARMHRLPLPDRIVRRKRAALAAHRSQLGGDASTGRGPVISASLRASAGRRFEMLVAP